MHTRSAAAASRRCCCREHALILIFIRTFDHFENRKNAADGRAQVIISNMFRRVFAVRRK